jgi:3-deoxy-7-phosphoheptulonate synthase
MKEFDFKKEFSSDSFNIIAGPCAVENYDLLYRTAAFLKELGIKFLRGGTSKLRTSPHSFQGLGDEAINYLNQIAGELGLYSVSEITDVRDIEVFSKKIDIILVGTRNMYNYPLLSEIGKTGKPVILKRGMSATIEEWLLAAEYIAVEGNKQIIMCERGIRTFEASTRNTLDLSAVSIVKKKCTYPVIVDPSHASGLAELVPSLSLASTAGGADGLIIELHPYPERALSDAQQMLDFNKFAELYEQIISLKSFLREKNTCQK